MKHNVSLIFFICTLSLSICGCSVNSTIKIPSASEIQQMKAHLRTTDLEPKMDFFTVEPDNYSKILNLLKQGKTSSKKKEWAQLGAINIKLKNSKSIGISIYQTSYDSKNIGAYAIDEQLFRGASDEQFINAIKSAYVNHMKQEDKGWFGDFAVIKVLTGNTFSVSPKWHLNNQSGNVIQIKGLQSPQENEKGFEKARHLLENIISPETITVKTPLKVSERKLLCNVFFNGKNIKDLINSKQK